MFTGMVLSDEVDTVDMEKLGPGNVVDVSSEGDASVEHHTQTLNLRGGLDTGTTDIY